MFELISDLGMIWFPLVTTAVGVLVMVWPGKIVYRMEDEK
jgi:hypothetical protein